MATQLFSEPHTANNGDFVSTALVGKCNCDTDMRALLNLPNESEGSFEMCPWHVCCIMWYQTARCQWYWDNREQLALDAESQPEFLCPNCFIGNEYYPATEVLEGAERLQGWLEWQKTNTRSFPAEMFYSHQVVAADDVEGHGLYEERIMVQEHGEKLWKQKEELKEAIRRSSFLLDVLNHELVGDRGIQHLIKDPLTLMSSIQSAKKHVQHAEYIELEAAALYGKMMKYAESVLTSLDRMAGTGDSVTSSDGSFSLSRDQLDLGGLDPAAIIEACDGPLKQVKTLQERFKRIEEMLEVLQRLHKNQGQSSGKSRRIITRNRKSKNGRDGKDASR